MDTRRLEELKEKLMRELDVVSGKSNLTLSDMQIIDTLTHSIKNLCKIIDEGSSSYGRWHADGSYNDGYSEKHYVRGHYSREPYEPRSYRDMLEREYSNARDDHDRETIRRMLDKMY